jgi:N-acetylmuramoyl-L-alanine amidase
MVSNVRASVARRALCVFALAVFVTVSVTASAAGTAVEKTINLDIAQRVTVLLRAAGVQVTMTRTTDQTVSLFRRTNLANSLHVDAFISIHNNASSDRLASGSMVFRSLRRDGSAALGQAIVDGLRAQLGSGRSDQLVTRRGDHGDYYYQLRETKMTAVLVEAAFVTNYTEGLLLAESPSYRQKIAVAIADGILAYQRTLTTARAPSLDPGRVLPGPMPAPTDGFARALGATRVSLAWSPAGLTNAYRIYRDGQLIAERPVAGARMSFTDPWAAPGQTYSYEIRAVQHVSSGLSLEGAPLRLSARTPAISVVLDPGHGGNDPGAIGRF